MTAEQSRYCVIIPVYNHHLALGNAVAELRALGLACLLVDDGSDLSTRQHLEALAGEGVEVIHLAINGGKGVAVCEGLIRARQQGFTHGVQIDADGQHRVDDLVSMLARSETYPTRVIAGARPYGSMPAGRRRGRRLTDMWVNINTLSTHIVDSMCGLRIYPLASTGALIQHKKIGARMEFDTDIAVQLYWAGVDFDNVPIEVAYLPHNTSHFRMFKDNVRITLMHARHFFRMLTRLPGTLTGRKYRG